MTTPPLLPVAVVNIETATAPDVVTPKILCIRYYIYFIYHPIPHPFSLKVYIKYLLRLKQLLKIFKVFL